MYRYTDSTYGDDEGGLITLQRDEVKGRIVGRGGRLIAYFEELFEVDVIFNDEPNTIHISCFNLVQREVAKMALERLMREKVITEEIILRVKELATADVDKVLRTEGERALKILGLANMPADFAKLIGRLKFRTSYGQNIMKHCFEVGYFARLLASELGADPHVAFLGGFFHDIGKAIDQEVGGSRRSLKRNSRKIRLLMGNHPRCVDSPQRHSPRNNRSAYRSSSRCYLCRSPRRTCRIGRALPHKN